MGVSNLLRYSDGNSIVHRLDPRVKMVWLLVLSLLVVLFGHPVVLIGLCAWAVGVHMAARIPWKRSKYLFLSYPFLIMVVALSQGVFFWGQHEIELFTIIGHQGKVLGLHIPWFSDLLVRWPGPLSFYKEGFIYGLIQSLRAVTLLTAGLTVALTTAPPAMLFGLRKFLFPYEFCFLIAMTIRFLPQIVDDIRGVHEAQRARGLSFRRFSLRDRARAALQVLSTVIILTLQEARDTALAIDMRAFRAMPTRVFVKEWKLTPLDQAILVGLLGLAAAAIALALKGYGAPPGYIYG